MERLVEKKDPQEYEYPIQKPGQNRMRIHGYKGQQNNRIARSIAQIWIVYLGIEPFGEILCKLYIPNFVTDVLIRTQTQNKSKVQGQQG